MPTMYKLLYFYSNKHSARPGENDYVISLGQAAEDCIFSCAFASFFISYGLPPSTGMDPQPRTPLNSTVSNIG